MIFELMSKGNLARLPDDMHVAGVPEAHSPRVLLLLPYNRFILGTATLKAYEKWVIGKLGADETEEIFLYDAKPKTLSLGDVEKVTIAKEAVDRLKACLRGQMMPPGEHKPTMHILRGFLKNDPLFFVDELLENEKEAHDYLERDSTARMAYWAIRFALFRNDYEEVSRIKTWIRIASDVFEGAITQPRIWFSLMDLPGGQSIEDMEALSYSVDDLQRMNSQSSRPVVLYSKSGYLVLSDYGNDSSGFRIWLYLPIPIWNEMRERRKLSIKEIVMATWGYLDGVAADSERSTFGCESLLSEENGSGTALR
ncbi:MAG: hypothetical protein GX181_07980 [Synergistaceae bacterium]|nr:hypothetical protein [Synergistota bacterium]NLM71880.1 hypothetical protein [Synergistaceae bacterium]